MLIRILTALAFLLPLPALACGGAETCSLGTREYHALPPPDWDGVSPLPVLLHFHGWGRRSSGVIKNSRIADAAAKAGALLLAPQGRGRSWRFWQGGSDDSDFALDVIDDAAKQWPIDRDRVAVSGFSYGGAMAWRMACDKGNVVKSYLPIAGSLPDPDQSCAGPVNLTHVHGLKDTVMDYPFGPNGEAEGAVSLWLAENQCAASPDIRTTEGPFMCHYWTSCTGPPITLCTHEGGHYIPKTWLADHLPRAIARE